MKAVDCVRLKTLKGVLEVLNPFAVGGLLGCNLYASIQIRLRQRREEKREPE